MLVPVIEKLEEYQNKVQELDQIDKYYMSSDNKVLGELIDKECQKMNIICSFDMTEEYSDEGVMAFQEEAGEGNQGQEEEDDDETIHLY